MAALNRPTNATYETHENVTIDTQDNEDHTFWWVKEWYRIVSHYWNITRYAFHDVTLYCVQKSAFSFWSKICYTLVWWWMLCKTLIFYLFCFVSFFLFHNQHKWSGIMFPIKCKDLLPIDHLVIKSVSVRYVDFEILNIITVQKTN